MLIPGIIPIIGGIIFVVCSIMVYKYAKKNEGEWVKTIGTIIGYRSGDNSSWSVPVIEFADNGEPAQASGPSMRDKSRPPAGTEVKIQYLKHEHTDKKPTYQVVLRRTGQTREKYLLKASIGIGIILCCIGVLLAVLS